MTANDSQPGKGVGYWLAIPAILCAAAAFFLYRKTGITEFNPSLSGTALVCLGIAAGLMIVSLFVDFKPIRYLAYLVCLYGFIAYISSQVTYITNVIVSIDGNTFTAGFIATAATFFLAFLLMLLSGTLAHPKQKKA